MKRVTCGLLLAAIWAVLGGCGGKIIPDVKIKMLMDDPPEAQVQKQLGVIVKTGDESQYFREVGELVSISRKANWDAGRLLKEVLDYTPRLEDNDQLARYQRLLDVLRAPRSAVVDAAAAHLPSSNVREAEIARNLLKWASPPDPRGPADFTQFVAYLRGHQAQLPQALVLWMYQRDPAAAMEQMMALYGSRMASEDMHTMVIAARVLDQFEWKLRHNLASAADADALAIEQLGKLARFEQWWVRLYAAQMLARYPQLRQDAIVERLTKDPDPLVRSVK